MSYIITSPAVRSRRILFGIVLSLAVLSHTRIFFYQWYTDPTNLETTNIGLFFVQFIAYTFAPATYILCGIHLYLKNQHKEKTAIAGSIAKKGLILIVLELTLNSFLWNFDPYFRTIGVLILGSLGIAFLVLAFLQFLPKKFLAVLGVLIITAHHFLDGIVMKGHSLLSIIWYIIYQKQFIVIEEQLFIFSYTLLPWLGLLLLGYAFGNYFNTGFPAHIRRKRMLITAGILITLFFVIRTINGYGEVPWKYQKDTITTVIDFFNITKYPASLAFITITTGIVLLLLYSAERWRFRGFHFFETLGRFPLFTYLLSTFVIHFTAMLFYRIMNGSWDLMTITVTSYAPTSPLMSYGYPLWVVYMFWGVFMGVLYGCCRVCNKKIHSCIQ
ncbi:hypothetical protein ACFSTE_16285 [Aquimarina hainanensis]|uniref:DUF1624 domain-containing protein n=1 Tax=Aquimarina hainanensis TaxID=1578017 RepID=A0ABW5NBM7_9FLAO